MDNQAAATLTSTMNTPATSAHSRARGPATPASAPPAATERPTGLITSAAQAAASGRKACDVVVEVLDDVEQEHDVGPSRLDEEVMGRRALARVEPGRPGHRQQRIAGIHSHRFAELLESGQQIAGAAAD